MIAHNPQKFDGKCWTFVLDFRSETIFETLNVPTTERRRRSLFVLSTCHSSTDGFVGEMKAQRVFLGILYSHCSMFERFTSWRQARTSIKFIHPSKCDKSFKCENSRENRRLMFKIFGNSMKNFFVTLSYNTSTCSDVSACNKKAEDGKLDEYVSWVYLSVQRFPLIWSAFENK